MHAHTTGPQRAWAGPETVHTPSCTRHAPFSFSATRGEECARFKLSKENDFLLRRPDVCGLRDVTAGNQNAQQDAICVIVITPPVFPPRRHRCSCTLMSRSAFFHPLKTLLELIRGGFLHKRTWTCYKRSARERNKGARRSPTQE